MYAFRYDFWAQNVRKDSFAAGAPPQTALGELRTLPGSLSWVRGRFTAESGGEHEKRGGRGEEEDGTEGRESREGCERMVSESPQNHDLDPQYFFPWRTYGYGPVRVANADRSCRSDVRRSYLRAPAVGRAATFRTDCTGSRSDCRGRPARSTLQWSTFDRINEAVCIVTAPTSLASDQPTVRSVSVLPSVDCLSCDLGVLLDDDTPMKSQDQQLIRSCRPIVVLRPLCSIRRSLAIGTV